MNWMRLKLICSVWAIVLAISVLPSPGTPTMSACPRHKQGRQQMVEDGVLADDDPADLLPQPFAGLAQLAHGLDVFVGRFAGTVGAGWESPWRGPCFE